MHLVDLQVGQKVNRRLRDIFRCRTPWGMPKISDYFSESTNNERNAARNRAQFVSVENAKHFQEKIHDRCMILIYPQSPQ